MTWKTNPRYRLPRLLAACSIVYLGLSSSFTPSLAAPSGAPSTQTQPSKSDLPQALGISELKLQMAESTYKLRPSVKTLSDLISSLEEVINSTCLAQLPRTLSFPGNPSDPECARLMARLLELHPENPVGLCLRDGIDATSCVTAYNQQVVVAYNPAEHNDFLTDPSLRVGITRQEEQKISELSAELVNLNEKYLAAAANPGERQRLIDLATEVYDQALAIACRITSTAFILSNESFDPASDPEVKEIREKLNPLPLSVREDHQGRLLQQAEEKLKTIKTGSAEWTRQQEVIKTIKRPEQDPVPSASSLQRTRIVLPPCAQFIQDAAAATQGFPAPTCHKDSWYSPQCIRALKNWRTIKLQRKATAVGTPGVPAKPTSIISTF